MTQLKDLGFQEEVVTQGELNTVIAPIDGQISSLQSDLINNNNALSSHLSNTSNPHSVTKTQIGLSNVDNTSDLNKPISTATQTALNTKANQSTTYNKLEVAGFLTNKVDVVAGKGLSQEDYTTVEKSKLAGIEPLAEVNNISDVNATSLTSGTNTSLHTHDSRYYTESETDTLLSTKANDNAVVKLTGNQSILGRKHFYDNDTFFGDGAKSYISVGNLGTNQEVYLDSRSDVYADVDMYIRAKGSNGDLRLVTNGTTRQTVLANGNIGIGEDSPDYKLDVNGSFGITPGIATTITPVDNGDLVLQTTSNTSLEFKLKGSDGVIRSGQVPLSSVDTNRNLYIQDSTPTVSAPSLWIDTTGGDVTFNLVTP